MWVDLVGLSRCVEKPYLHGFIAAYGGEASADVRLTIVNISVYIVVYVGIHDPFLIGRLVFCFFYFFSPRVNSV